MKYIIFTIFLFSSITGIASAGNLNDSGNMLNQAAGVAGYDIEQNDPAIVVAKVINTALSFLGVIFLALMVYGGFIWMTARGNDQQIDKAKGILTAAIIGVVVILSAYAITYFVISQVGNQTLQ